MIKVGIIGGSGLYNLEDFKNIKEVQLYTPFGNASEVFVEGTWYDIPVVFLSRHGRGHRILPTEIPFKANIWGMKKLGVTHLISVSAVGSLKEEIKPGHIVLPDQFIDLTKNRDSTFFGKGLVVHTQFGDPICASLLDLISKASQDEGITHHCSGTYVCIEGPLFSTRAESNLYRSWGASVIGMTNAQEAKLAREAEMSFATIALATDYDCWHQSEEEVTVEAILEVMKNNVENCGKILSRTFELMTPDFPSPYKNALEFSILTQKDLIPQKVKDDLGIIIGKYL